MDLKKALKDVITFQIDSKIRYLYKDFLVILEDIRDEQYKIDSDSFERIRKRVLDRGNDTIRELRESFDKVDFILKQVNESEPEDNEEEDSKYNR